MPVGSSVGADYGQPTPSIDDATWEVPTAEICEFSARRTRFGVLIPVIDEGARIRTQLARMQDAGVPSDVIISDGGSRDGSMDHEYLRAHGVRALLIKRGPGGVGAQLRIGFAFCLRQGYDGIVTVDGNNKDGIESIPTFLKALSDGADFVQGSRFAEGGGEANTPRWRRWAIKAIHSPVVSFGAGRRLHDTTNGFRGYSRRLLVHPAVLPFRDVFRNRELLWYLPVRAGQLGLEIREVPVIRRYPASGPVPTKIGVWGSAQILVELARVTLGFLHPR